MIDINELRPAVEAAGLNAISMQEVLELLDRLEAAESDALEQARLNGIGASREAALMAKLEAAEKERDALQAKVEAMEKQFPICRVKDIKRAHYMTKVVGLNPDAWLYLAPGAQPAPSALEGCPPHAEIYVGDDMFVWCDWKDF